ncbi:Hypothetical predicted protein [Scomber scombrus]|uniref:Uncharacterized protein n=1 Tax=Scomber scombrus TaxID=13677 RepID=A0AAV1NKR6_SCOSC
MAQIAAKMVVSAGPRVQVSKRLFESDVTEVTDERPRPRFHTVSEGNAASRAEPPLREM